MHPDLHIEDIEKLLKNLLSALDVTFEIRDFRGHLIGSVANKLDDQELYRELFTTIAATRQSHMLMGSRGEAIWGIPIVTNGNIQESFIVLHRKSPPVISAVDTDETMTTLRTKKTSEQAIVTLVEDVLQLLTSRHISECDLDTMTQELSTCYEELNFFYQIGGMFATVKDFNKTVENILSKAIEILHTDYAALHIPCKDIFKSVNSHDDKELYQYLSQVIITMTPELLTLFQKEIDYLTDGDLKQSPLLKSFLKIYRHILVIPVSFDEIKTGIFILGRQSADGTFSICDKRLMSVIGDIMTIKIENTESFKELKDLSLNLMKSFTEAIEEKDAYTRGHSERVNKWSLIMGRLLELNPQEMGTLNVASILHDIGKIGIPEKILSKSGKLSDEEYDFIKEHPVKGYKILLPIRQLKESLASILYHHERIDGKGYPQGLSGDEIPLIARIIAVADTFDAMTSQRSYRKAKPIAEVIQEMQDVSGKQLDSDITRLFITKCLGKAIS